MAELPRPLPPPSWRDWQPPPLWALIAGVVAVLAVVAGAVVFTRSGNSPPDIALSLPRADSTESAATPTTVAGVLHVHAAGAVARPGVVEVPGGARVTDVVAAAGGPAPDADLDQVNLAAPVSDGERVYIPRRGETVSATASPRVAASDGIVNINTADQAALETLPGVGPSTAKAILDYRAEHGRFRSVDDLLNVRGIGPAKLSQIKPHVRV